MLDEIEIRHEQPEHVSAREAMLDRVMGPIRFRRASERLREGRLPAAGLAFVATSDNIVVGTVRLWNVRTSGLTDGLLLGPLAVDGSFQGRGIGRALVCHAIATSRSERHDAIILVGDAPYYSAFGFSARSARRLAVPGPFERDRLLGLELVPDALLRAHGTLRASGLAAPASKSIQLAA